MHRQEKAAAQFFHLLDRIEAALRLLGQASDVVDQQVGIGLVVRPAHAPAQLVQLRQTELVRPVHDDRVRGRHVDAGLDDGRAQQDVVALRHEVAHDLFEVALVHLSVRHADARLGQQLGQHRHAVLDGLDFVVQEVDLAAAFEFAQAGLADDRAVFAAHERFDGQALLRCCGDDRKIAQPFERHAQRARDRRCGQGQHVNFGAQRLERFFLAHAEAVFLVDDDQSQARELHIGREQLVGANDDIERAVGHALDGVVDLFTGTKTRQLGDAHRPVGKAVGKGLCVLLGQQGSGRQNRHLLAAHDGDEGSTQRDFGLAEADVAAHQPVHRFAGGHILDDVVDRLGLVGRLFKAERVGEVLVVVRGVFERVAFAQRAPGVQVEQFGGRVAHLFGRLALGFLPLAGAERMQRRVLGRGARIARNDMQLRHRHVQLGVLGVLQVQEFGFAFAQVHAGQAHVAPDAVIDMDYRVTDLELGQVTHHRLDLGDAFLLLFAGAPARARIELGLAVKIGDSVLYGKYAGTELKLEGKDYLIMREDDILAII